jgi:hypothetical protein
MTRKEAQQVSLRTSVQHYFLLVLSIGLSVGSDTRGQAPHSRVAPFQLVPPCFSRIIKYRFTYPCYAEIKPRTVLLCASSTLLPFTHIRGSCSQGLSILYFLVTRFYLSFPIFSIFGFLRVAHHGSIFFRYQGPKCLCFI